MYSLPYKAARCELWLWEQIPSEVVLPFWLCWVVQSQMSVMVVMKHKVTANIWFSRHRGGKEPWSLAVILSIVAVLPEHKQAESAPLALMSHTQTRFVFLPSDGQISIKNNWYLLVVTHCIVSSLIVLCAEHVCVSVSLVICSRFNNFNALKLDGNWSWNNQSIHGEVLVHYVITTALLCISLKKSVFIWKLCLCSSTE